MTLVLVPKYQHFILFQIKLDQGNVNFLAMSLGIYYFFLSCYQDQLFTMMNSNLNYEKETIGSHFLSSLLLSSHPLLEIC